MSHSKMWQEKENLEQSPLSNLYVILNNERYKKKKLSKKWI